MKSQPRGFQELAPLTLLVILVGLSLAPPVRSSEVELLPPKVHLDERAPDFALESSEGKTVKLSDFAGHNVLVDFYRGYW